MSHAPPPKHPGSLQARLSQNDPRLYNANRDLAHNFQMIAKLVAGRLEDRVWPELTTLLDKHGVTDDELGAACQAYCLFVGSQADDPHETMLAGLDRSGWLRVRPEAQVAVLAVLGTVVLGIQYAGVREATLGGEGPAATLHEVIAWGERSSKLLALPRWRRRWAIWTNRLRSAWRVMSGK